MPTFTVKITLSDARASELQDFGGMLRRSTEDVLAAAVLVGLTDWEAVEGQMIVDPPEGQLPEGRRLLRAALDLDLVQADAVDVTADWFDRGLSEFLADCLQSGIAHAQSSMAAEQEAMAAKRGSAAPDDDLMF